MSSILSKSKRNFKEEIREEPSAKKARVPMTEKENGNTPIFAQNCVVNVYGRGSVDNVQPVQNNAFSGSSSPDYESDMDHFFANIAHLIP